MELLMCVGLVFLCCLAINLPAFARIFREEKQRKAEQVKADETVMQSKTKRDATAGEKVEQQICGTCGDGMSWRLEGDILYIEGKGEIAESAFEGDESFSQVVIAPGCTGIGADAFLDCKNLWDVDLPEGLERIGEEAFLGCTALQCVEFPATVTHIGARAFWNCVELVSAIPMEGMEIGKDAFFEAKDVRCYPVRKKAEPPYLTPHYTYGNHLYRSRGDDASVYFVDEARGIRKMIVDFNGWIQDFPGIVKEDFWVNQIESGSLMHQIRFRTDFEERGDKFIMRWQVQPDGRYWEDEDGFGMTPEEEIVLYAYIDMNGNFTGPFRIYRIGWREFYSEEHP